MLKQVLAVVAITAATLVAEDTKKVTTDVTTTSVEVAPEKLEVAAPAATDKDAKKDVAVPAADAKTPATDAVATPATTTEKK